MTINDFANGTYMGQGVRTELHAVSGKENRTIEVALSSGQVRYGNGEVASTSWLDAFDGVAGVGSFSGNMVSVFEDGSTLSFGYAGTAKKRSKSNRADGKGEWKITGGTGRFAKVQGGGTFKNEAYLDKFNGTFSGSASKSG